MDPVRELIVQRVKELGLNLAAASKKAKLNHAYLQQFVRRGIPRKLPEEVRGKLAPVLQVEEDDLRHRQEAADAPLPALGLARATQTAPVGAPLSGEAVIPLYGQAAGGKDGAFVFNGNKVADILAPPALVGVRDAYAVYVVGDSMENRYFSGETVYVNPRAPVRKGDFVVVQIAAEEGDPPLAFVKRFAGRDARLLKLEQLNPRKALSFPNSRVVSIHRIIMGGDG